MHFFKYRNNSLYCEDVKISKIAKDNQTPFYLYSSKTLIRHLKVLQDAFKEISPLICFSMKANSSLAICKLLIDKGAGLDIVSGGELFKALKIGADPKKIVYAGVGKSEEEIDFALSKKILLLNVESIPEIELINKVAEKRNMVQKIAIRINPDIEPLTHKYIVTGKKFTKFGIDFDNAECLILNKIKKYKNVDICGLHVHIGSQITKADPFKKTLDKLKRFILKLKKKGFIFEYVNIGGGLGIIYNNEKPQTAQEFSDHILSTLKSLNSKIIMEPGRFIVGNSGILVTKILYVKETPFKKFIVVDAGMNDLLRPSLYNAYHEILSLKDKNRLNNSDKFDIVGPICESGDFLGKDRKLPLPKAGDFLAVMGAGAYGFSMANNYNSRVLPAEIIVKSKNIYIIRKPQKYSQLIQNEIIPKDIF